MFTPRLFNRFWRYDRMFAAEVGSCGSLLDVGCGSNSPVRRLVDRVPIRVGVDAFEPSLEESRRAGIHTDTRCMDILQIGAAFPPGSFDCVVASDVIEHLEKDDGRRLLADMERIARFKVVVFTPNGFVPQEPYENNPWQRHLSGWSADEMQGRGYRVVGVNGWKGFFRDRGQLRWQPRVLWKWAAIASRGATVSRPRLAYQILCVKDKPR